MPSSGAYYLTLQIAAACEVHKKPCVVPHWHPSILAVLIYPLYRVIFAVSGEGVKVSILTVMAHDGEEQLYCYFFCWKFPFSFAILSWGELG